MIAVIHDFGFRNTIDSSKLITDSLYMHTGFKNRMRIIWYKKTMIEKNNPFLEQRLSNFFCLTRWSLFRTLSRKKSCHCCAWNTLPKYRKYHHRSSRKFPTSTQVLNRTWEYLRDKNTPISSTNHRSTSTHYTVRTAPHTSRQTQEITRFDPFSRTRKIQQKRNPKGSHQLLLSSNSISSS